MSAPAVLVLGATSGIGRSIASAFARRGYALYVAGRGAEETDRLARDLGIRHGGVVHAGTFDIADTASHAELLSRVVATAGGLEGVVVTVGLLGEHERALSDFAHAREILEINFVGVASILAEAANYLEPQGHGFIVGVSSVAGDRGRQSNYVYGSAKGAVSLFLQGLRNRLARSGVRVHTVKPGPVDTAMTYGRPGVALAADPAAVGERIVRAVERGTEVIYVPGFWRYVMLAIRLVPEGLFKRMRL